jgi:hypothetical protein
VYAWLWRHLPGGPRARAAQLCVAVALVVLVCFVWVFPAVEALLTRNGATVGSAPQPIDRGATPMATTRTGG